jgi:hypothetical protein
MHKILSSRYHSLAVQNRLMLSFPLGRVPAYARRMHPVHSLTVHFSDLRMRAATSQGKHVPSEADGLKCGVESDTSGQVVKRVRVRQRA